MKYPRYLRTLPLLCLLLGAAWNASAQKQPVTARWKAVPLPEVIREIEQQTGLSLMMERDSSDAGRTVTATWKDTPVQTVLEDLFGKSRTIVFKDSFVLIQSNKTETATAPRDSVSEPAGEDPEPHSFSGVVVDESGEPVTGAGVIVKGTTRGVTTDLDGTFSIDDVEPGTVLVISALSYQTAEVTVGNAGFRKIILRNDGLLLDEVVVVGYGTQKKVNLTGSVASIGSKELEQRPVASATQALQGLDPSMYITFGSGSPESSQSMTIRGSVSINSGSPLVLVDGVEMSLRYVNPNDIESISILKDASASAIYGTKASAGVVLVTTKSGAKEAGKAKITFSSGLSVITNTASTDFITTGYDHVRLNNEFFDRYPNGNRLVFNEEEMQMLYERRNDVTENPERPWVLVGSDGKWRYYGNFDWYDFSFNTERLQQDYNVSVRGGDDKVNYYVSGRYYDMEGMFNPTSFGANGYKTWSFRGNFDIRLNRSLKYTSNLAFANNVMTYPGGFTNYEATIWCLHTNVSPVFLPYNPDGTNVTRVSQLSSSNNITQHRLGSLLEPENYNKKNTEKYTLKNGLTWTILPGWTATASYTLVYQDIENVFRSTEYDCGEGPGIITHIDVIAPYYTEQRYHYLEQTVEAFTNYETTLGGRHHMAATAGMQYYDYAYRTNGMKATSLIDDALSSLSPDTLTEGITDAYTGGQDIRALKTLGVFARANYDYKGRYLLEASARADGSSRFEKKHRWAFFPSVSAGWRISDEPFFQGLRGSVSNLKLRYSLGSLGNQQMSSYYPYYEIVTAGTAQNYTLDGTTRLLGASVSDPVSSGLTWETVTTNNIGLDLGLFDGRLTFTADAYIRDTKNMLTTSITLPSVYGASTPKENCADLRTKGYELYLTWKDRIRVGGRDLGYSLTGTFGDYKTVITRYNNPDRLLSDHYEGRVLGEIWGYHVLGLFASDEEANEYMSQVDARAVQGNVFNSANADESYLRAGDVIFWDKDGNGVISQGSNTVDDPGDRMIIGNSRPRYLYSGRLDLDWRGIDLSVFFQGVGHRDWYPTAGDKTNTFWACYALTPTPYIHKDFESYCWSEDNTDAYFPRRRNKEAHSGSALCTPNDRYLQNVGYLRFKNLSIGYTLPLKSRTVDKLRIGLTGENLWYWSPLKRYCKTLDPEMAGATDSYGTSSIGYTYPKTFTCTVQLTF